MLLIAVGIGLFVLNPAVLLWTVSHGVWWVTVVNGIALVIIGLTIRRLSK